jgi:hypothetical protein
MMRSKILGRARGALQLGCGAAIGVAATLLAGVSGGPDTCRSNGDCPDGFYCQKTVGDCEGVGVCTPMPQGCPDVFDPVCGCDGVTYGNACEAAAAGVNVAFLGECVTEACFGNEACPKGFYCKKPVGQCDGPGVCTETPTACIEIFDPVCGCDGVTYDNECFAAAAGVSVAHEGPCEKDVCLSNAECPEGFYCQKALGDCNGPGMCVPIPTACPDVVDPVCGCDGVTYFNACEAAAAGVSVAHEGECGQACTDNGDCPDGFYCKKPAGQCEGKGVCAPMPELCPLVFAPVCGCDGVTYDNECFAAAAGVNVLHDGPCKKVCVGDLNGDGEVDGADLGLLLANWGPCKGSP